MSTVEQRLAHLRGLDLSEQDLRVIRAELEAYEQALAELEAFAAEVPWVSAPVLPPASPGQEP